MAYYFKLPATSELTLRQNDAIISSSNDIKIEGGPGTGKSVVCIYKHIQNLNKGKTSLLLTYTLTLEHALKGAVIQNAKKTNDRYHVGRIFKDSDRIVTDAYNEIIIDEGQDVDAGRFKLLRKKTNSMVFAGDFDQSLYLSEEELDDLNNWIENDFNYQDSFNLDKNFRTPREILEFVRQEFPNFSITANNLAQAKAGNAPTIIDLNVYDFNEELDVVFDILSEIGINSTTTNIAILLPSGKLVDKAFEYLKAKGVNASKYRSTGEEILEIENIHITTYKSSKGLEFDHVILPKYRSKDWFLNNTKNFSEKDYFVALTRTSNRLYIIK